MSNTYTLSTIQNGTRVWLAFDNINFAQTDILAQTYTERDAEVMAADKARIEAQTGLIFEALSQHAQ